MLQNSDWLLYNSVFSPTSNHLRHSILYSFCQYSIEGSPNLMEFHSIDKNWMNKIGASPASPECACADAFTCSYSVMVRLE